VRRLQLVAAWAALAAVVAPPAAAHETKPVGPLRLTIGWGDEPAYSGLRNDVEVGVSHADGTPVRNLAGALTVEVSFGEARVALPLLPFEEPGELRAAIVPTRPGTYSFQLTGSVEGQAIDTTSTCSEETFDCVLDVSEIQFPAQDPPSGQLAERLARSLSRTEQAENEATDARRLALVAIALGALALLTSLALGLRRMRKRT